MCSKEELLVGWTYKVHSRNFLSACFKEIHVFNMFDRSLAHTKWLFKPKIWAANWAAPSGDRVVGQPRPAKKAKCYFQKNMFYKHKQNIVLNSHLEAMLVSALKSHII